MGFFEEYFVEPIYSYSGYNVVNTTVYALLALAALFAIYKLFKAKGIALGEEFFKGVVAFTLFGSAKRAVTDAVDAGLFSGPLAALYAYEWWNVSPAIYVFVGLLFLLTWVVEVWRGWRGLTWKAGLALAVLHLLPLLPQISHWWPVLLSLAGAGLIYGLAYAFFKDKWLALPPAAHALDGLASVLAITLLFYGEQHVLANAIMSIHPWLFPLAKVAVAFAFSHYLKTEKDPTLYWILLSAATVMGLAPGFRNLLRASIGV